MKLIIIHSFKLGFRMSKEDSPIQENEENKTPSPAGFRTHNLSLVVGDSGSESSGDMQDMRSRMQSFAINVDEGMPPSTIFIEDTDVILPSTSQTEFNTQCEIIASSLPKEAQQMSDIDMNNFVRDLFANDTIMQRGIESNFIDEIFTEKPPKILKEYLFGHVIGEGSYSKVKEVLHVKSLMRRAVKIIKDKRIKKIPGGEQNVQREIEVLQQLSHPNVVKVVEIFRIEEKQKLYIVMEFCVCSLQQMLDNCPEKMLPEFQAHLYFTQLLDGLNFLHSKSIIHKDIKPGNLLLSLDGILKICDLGVAELLTPETEGDWCTLVQGTPKFQPPEIVSGLQRRFRGSLVDIWACGITLYNIVSGDYPFDGDVIMKLFENITNNPLKMPSNVELSADLEQLLKGMLQKEPERRWNSLRIRASKWFSKLHQIDNYRIVHVPPIKDIPAHRPLGILNFLEQMYGQSEGESERGEEQHGAFEQTGASGFNHCSSNISPNHQQPERQVKIEFEESEPILAGYSGGCGNSSGNVSDDCGENGNEEDKVNVDDNYGRENLQRQERLVKISVARLRQILFITLCSLIVLASLAVLFLML